MKTYKSKTEVFDTIKNYLGFDKIVVTGSTALKLWGLVEESSELDLDLVIYDIKPSSWDKLTALHGLFGIEQILYPPSCSTTRDVGALVSLAFPTPSGAEIQVHVFCMETEKMTKMNRPFFNMNVLGRNYWVNHPMNIIEAKKTHGRDKDFKQLFDMCALIIKPLPVEESAPKEYGVKSTDTSKIMSKN